MNSLNTSVSFFILFSYVELSSGYIGGTLMSVVMAGSHVLLGANKEEAKLCR